VALAANGDEALLMMQSQVFDLLLSDMVMGKMSGIELLGLVREKQPGLPVIMITGFGSIQTAIEAMRGCGRLPDQTFEQ
jgi:DNA-binding NtrC family response regulator